MLYSVASQVLEAAAAALASTVNGMPAVRYVALGAVAWDGCDTCGQLTITLVAPFLADSILAMATPMTDQTPCASAEVGGSFVLQLVRCAPGPDARGNPPSSDSISVAAGNLMADYEAVLPAVMCELSELRDADTILGFSVGPGATRGPDGNCAGFDLPLSVVAVRA